MDECMIDYDYGPIKPCPFCKASGKVTWLGVNQDDSGWFLFCKFCGAKGPVALTLKSAQDKWNRREST